MEETLTLLVDDDPVMRYWLGDILAQAGYDVVSVTNGQAALDYLEQRDVDLIITDIRMHEVSGIDVLNSARSRPFPPEVVVFTGYGSLDTAIAAIRAGAFNYLLKPFQAEELLACVRAALERRLVERRRLETIRTIARQVNELIKPELPSRDEASALPEPGDAQRILRVGILEIDRQRRLAFNSGHPLHLTPIEFALLSYLAETPGQVRSSAEIVQHTHKLKTGNAEAQTLLRTHIRNLRRKIPEGYLITVRSSGYMLHNTAEP